MDPFKKVILKKKRRDFFRKYVAVVLNQRKISIECCYLNQIYYNFIINYYSLYYFII